MIQGKCSFCGTEGDMTRFHKVAAHIGGSWTGKLACDDCRIRHNLYEAESIRFVKKLGFTQITPTKLIGEYHVYYVAGTCEANVPFLIPTGTVVSINARQSDCFDTSEYKMNCVTGGSTMVITGSPSAELYWSVCLSGDSPGV